MRLGIGKVWRLGPGGDAGAHRYDSDAAGQDENRTPPEEQERERVTDLVLRLVRPRRSGEDGRDLGALAGALRRGSGGAGRAAKDSGRWLTDQVLATAPRIPVRDLATLRAQYPAASPEELADALVDSAVRASGAVGAAAGMLAVLPNPPGLPFQIAAETLAVVGLEVKLVAELHEVYGLRAGGGVVDRMTSYVVSWTNRRGVTPTPAGMSAVLGAPLKRRLRRALMLRSGRSVASVGPLLTGAMAGALVNRHGTRRLAEALRADLRAHSAVTAHWPTDWRPEPGRHG
jgi:hypothetical protein